MRLIDLTGQKFGRLTVVERDTSAPRSGGKQWRCVCECGESRVVRSFSLRAGHTRSCGRAGCRVRRTKTHGMGGTPEYGAWHTALTRCTVSTNPDYQYYGGRGIAMCPEWADDFLTFYKHVGPKPDSEYMLSRIDKDRDYEPGNVEWALPSDTMRAKWPRDNPERAPKPRVAKPAKPAKPRVERPAKPRFQMDAEPHIERTETARYEIFKIRMGVNDWADSFRIPREVLLERLCAGWPLYAAITGIEPTETRERK